MTADEPTAIRHPHRGQAHREVGLTRSTGEVACSSRDLRWALDPERVPLSSVPTTDLCKTCWPTTKDVTP